LASVSRLEEFPARSVERVGHREVIQYRGGIMPLVHLGSSSYGYGEESNNGQFQVVVCGRGSKNVGFVVGQILDVVDQAGDSDDVDLTSDTQIIADRVTQIVDVNSLIESHFPELANPIFAA
ncbi:MAG: chemotaxis protein CheW, partial [Planctomycetales bacterium]|nr:chemotaxis protein CheW [Planctomycetales bacterium]